MADQAPNLRVPRAFRQFPLRYICQETRETLQTQGGLGQINLDGQYVVAWSTTNSRFEYNDGTSGAGNWAALVTAGSQGTLDQAYDSGSAGGGRSATIDSGTVLFTDTQTNVNSTFSVLKTGVVAGAVSPSLVSVSSTAAHTTSGNVRGITVDFSASTFAAAPTGVRVAMEANTSNAFLATVGGITLTDGALVLTSGNFTMTSGSQTITAGSLTLSDGTLDITEATAQTSFAVTNNTVTTQVLAQIDSTSLTSGTGLLIQLSDTALNAGFYFRCRDSIGAADEFTVAENGATVITGAAAGTNALTLTAGDLRLTSGHVILTSGNATLTSGNLVLTSGNVTLTAGNATFTDGNVTMSEGTLAITNTTVGEAAFNLTANGARTVAISTIATNSTGNAPIFDINISGATHANGHLFDVDLTGAGAGAILDALVGVVLYTGDLVKLDLGATSTAGQAIVVAGGAAARTTALCSITDSGTNAGSALAITGAGTDGVVTITIDAVSAAEGLVLKYSAAGTGPAQHILMATAGNAAAALVIDDGNRDFSVPMVDLTASGAGGATGIAALRVTLDAVGNPDGVYIRQTAVGSGILFNSEVAASGNGRAGLFNTTSSGTSAMALQVTGSKSAYANAQVDFQDQAPTAAVGAAIFMEIDRAATQNNPEALLYLDDNSTTGDGRSLLIDSTATTGFAANEGRVLHVLASGAINGAVAGASVARFQASGVWAGADSGANRKSVVHMIHSGTSAANDGDYVLRVDSDQPANIAALWIEDGDLVVGVENGTYTRDVQKVYVALEAAQMVTIDGDAIDRTGATGCLQIDAGLAFASSAGISVLMNAAVDGTTVGITVNMDAVPTALGAGNATLCFHAVPQDAAADNTSAMRVAYGAMAPTDNAGAGEFVGYYVDTGYDYAFRAESGVIEFFDYAATIRTFKSSAGAGPALTIKGGDADTAGVGGILNLTGGIALGANADGDVIIRVHDAGTDAGRFRVRNETTTTDVLEYDPDRTLATTTKATQSGLKVLADARPWRTLSIPLSSFFTNASPPVAATVAYAGTVDVRDQYAYINLADAASTTLGVNLLIPPDYDDTSGTAPDLILELVFVPQTATIGVGETVGWRYDFTATATAEAIPAAGALAYTAGSFTSAAGAEAAGDAVVHRITISAPNIDANDLLQLWINRNGAGDTFNQAVRLVRANLIYRADRL